MHQAQHEPSGVLPSACQGPRRAKRRQLTHSRESSRPRSRALPLLNNVGRLEDFGTPSTESSSEDQVEEECAECSSSDQHLAVACEASRAKVDSSVKLLALIYAALMPHGMIMVGACLA